MNKRIQTMRNVIQLMFLGLLLTGAYMKLKPIFIFLLLLSLVVGNFFCGWICPYGAAQDFFGSIGDKIFKKRYKMPQSIQRYLQFSRYIIVVFTAVGIGVTFFESVNSYKVFMVIGESFTRGILSISLVIMISFLAISMLFERPFCNYLCIEATKYGVASLIRIFTIKRKGKSCINCKKCNKVCPMNIYISNKEIIRSAQCINCFRCISACPVRNTLSYGKAKAFSKKG